MLITKTYHDKQCHIALAGALTVFHVAQINAAVMTEVAQCATVIVTLHAVQSVDSAGLQLLLFYKKYRTKKHDGLTLITPSKAIMDWVVLFEIEHLFASHDITS